MPKRGLKMAKLYKDLSTEELKQEIHRLEEAENFMNKEYDTSVAGQTPLELYQTELQKRAQS